MRKIPVILVFILLILILPWMYISLMVQGNLYRDIETLPEREVGLLLGTSPSSDGLVNLFYTTRIEAAKMLYEQGKIHHILVSGDNSTPEYNEPKLMKDSLIRAGIPETAITMDFAGFRTLDSVVRAHEIFSLTGGMTIISQPFHVERALFLAESRGIDAIWYGTANISLSLGLRTYIREIGARWLALYDAYFGTDPVVLGKKEKLNGE